MLTKDSGSKTHFSASNKFYQQIDDVSIGSFFFPLLAKIIFTEMEKTIIKRFIADKRSKDSLNNFDKNLNFTFDKFDNVVPHFVDIEIHPDRLIILKTQIQGNRLSAFGHFVK